MKCHKQQETPWSTLMQGWESKWGVRVFRLKFLNVSKCFQSCMKSFEILKAPNVTWGGKRFCWGEKKPADIRDTSRSAFRH